MESVRDFMADHAAREDEREKQELERHRENKERLDKILRQTAERSLLVNIAAVLVAIAMLAVTIAGIVVASRVARGVPVHMTGNFQAYGEAENNQ